MSGIKPRTRRARNQVPSSHARESSREPVIMRAMAKAKYPELLGNVLHTCAATAILARYSDSQSLIARHLQQANSSRSALPNGLEVSRPPLRAGLPLLYVSLCGQDKCPFAARRRVGSTELLGIPEIMGDARRTSQPSRQTGYPRACRAMPTARPVWVV